MACVRWRVRSYSRRMFRLFRYRSISVVAGVLLLAGLTSCGPAITSDLDPGQTTNPTSGPPIWVGAWGDSMTDANAVTDNTGGTDRSFRFLVATTIDGTQARVKFSNVYGTTPVTIGAARVAIGTNGTAAVTGNTVLTFSGSNSVTMQPGTTVTSDSANITFQAGATLAISAYLKGSFGAVSRHDSSFITNYTTADSAGDVTGDATGNSYTATLGDWLLVNEVDTYGQYQGTLVMFGSSTTDGFKSNYSSDQVYPTPNVPVATQLKDRPTDWMRRRLIGLGYRIGVVNAGIPGNTVTTLSAAAYNGELNANQRITQDVLGVPNLLGMVTYFGSIDLRSSDCKSAPEIETATTQMVAAAYAAKVPLVMATLPPSAFCMNSAQANYGPFPTSANPYAGGLQTATPNGAEVQRAAFNAWVRTTGMKLPGVSAIADYDLALRDPNNISFMQAPYNSGDNQHMTGAGYHAEVLSIPLGFLPAP
jgi:hypothetical protein